MGGPRWRWCAVGLIWISSQSSRGSAISGQSSSGIGGLAFIIIIIRCARERKEKRKPVEPKTKPRDKVLERIIVASFSRLPLHDVAPLFFPARSNGDESLE